MLLFGLDDDNDEADDVGEDNILETKKSLFFLKFMSAGAGHNFHVLRLA